MYQTIAAPVLAEFSPQLTLVSAGFDAHEADPLASMRMTASGYGRIIERVKNAASGTPVAVVTEGGYDLPALRECLEVMIGVFASGGATAETVDETVRAPVRGERALQTVRAAQSAFWRGI